MNYLSNFLLPNFWRKMFPKFSTFVTVGCQIVLQQFDHLRRWFWRLWRGELPEDGDWCHDVTMSSVEYYHYWCWLIDWCWLMLIQYGSIDFNDMEHRRRGLPPLLLLPPCCRPCHCHGHRNREWSFKLAKINTLPETNIAAENRPSQKQSHLLTITVQVLCWFQGGLVIPRIPSVWPFRKSAGMIVWAKRPQARTNSHQDFACSRQQCLTSPRTSWVSPPPFFLSCSWQIHPGKLTWNLKITCLKGKIIFQTSIFGFNMLIFLGKYSWTKCHAVKSSNSFFLITRSTFALSHGKTDLLRPPHCHAKTINVAVMRGKHGETTTTPGS